MKKIISLVILVMILGFGSALAYTPTDSDKKIVEKFEKSLEKFDITKASENEKQKLLKIVSKIDLVLQKLKEDSKNYYLLSEIRRIIQEKTSCQPGMTEITLSNGQTWSCMNVGATEVWDGKTQPKDCNGSMENCNKDLKWIGDYYQWGRNDTGFTNDWQYKNSNAWGGSGTKSEDGIYKEQSVENQKLMQGPCSNGWHVPTTYEWHLSCDSILGKYCNDEHDYGLITKLKLPIAGSREDNGYYYNQSTFAYYWSSTPNPTYAHHIFLNTRGVVDIDSVDYRWNGFSIRCLKNY